VGKYASLSKFQSLCSYMKHLFQKSGDKHAVSRVSSKSKDSLFLCSLQSKMRRFKSFKVFSVYFFLFEIWSVLGLKNYFVYLYQYDDVIIIMFNNKLNTLF